MGEIPNQFGTLIGNLSIDTEPSWGTRRSHSLAPAQSQIGGLIRKQYKNHVSPQTHRSSHKSSAQTAHLCPLTLQHVFHQIDTHARSFVRQTTVSQTRRSLAERKLTFFFRTRQFTASATNMSKTEQSPADDVEHWESAAVEAAIQSSGGAKSTGGSVLEGQ